ncbi:MAG: apolipoprotein N-acyltransferase, partial [Opitutales bacterium]|nr:apolipoprotein N-acyltransferase [Opitutales bacterium]
ASQWDRPALLQILPFTGWSGLSWLLAYFNLALASYVITIIHPRRDLNWWRRLNPELYSALLLLAGSVASVLTVVHGHAEPEKLFNAGLIQPYVPGTLKWDAELANDNIQRLEALSNFAAIQEADVVFWPESATPWPVISPNPSTQLWVEDLARRKNVSIVMGNFAQIMDADKGEQYFNGVFVVDPQNGLSSNWYAKRKLVPFGEYDPLGPITKLFFEWPTAFFTSGRALADKAPLLRLKLDVHDSLSIGALLCYEDIFPALARKEVKEGADFLFVATNNAWYGEEAGAYQHALHSILRAVENRRPVLRCGNGGWSGMIDEYGAIRYIATRPEMGVYFEGEDVFEMVRSPDWKGKFSFYTRHGDWFVILCALAAGIALWFALKRPLDEESGTDLEEDEQDEARRKAHELLRRGKLRFGRRTGRF